MKSSKFLNTTILAATIGSFAFIPKLIHAVTTPPTANVSVVNNSGKPDTITLTAGLSKGTSVRVYDSSGNTIIGRGEVSDQTKPTTVSIGQISASSTTINVSLKDLNDTESAKISYNVAAESQSNPLSTGNINVINNVDKADTVTVRGVSEGSLLKIYASNSDGTVSNKVLGSTVVPKGKSEVTIDKMAFGINGGKIFVSHREVAKSESAKTELIVGQEAESIWVYQNITVENNAGTTDTVTIGKGLSKGTIVKVYDLTETKVIGSSTISDETKDTVIKIPQIGESASSIYISAKEPNKWESIKRLVNTNAEEQTVPLSVTNSNIEVKNNAGKPDTVKVTNVPSSNLIKDGTVIKVYDSIKNKVIGTAKVAKDKFEVMINVPQIGTDGGRIYVTATEKNKLESLKYGVNVIREEQTSTLNLISNNIRVSNNAGNSDVVKVSNIITGTVIKAYDSLGTKVIGTAIAKTTNGITEAVITINQIGAGAGTIKLTTTEPNKLESLKLDVNVQAELKTNIPNTRIIAVENNARNDDKITVSGIAGLQEGTVFKIYDSNLRMIGTGKLTVNATTSTVVTFNIKQVGTSAGTIKISATEPNKQESDKIDVFVNAEQKSDQIVASNIIVTNVATSDSVRVIGLVSGTIVKVYDTTGSRVLGTATSSGTEVTLSIRQLGRDGGVIKVSVSVPNKLESDKVDKTFTRE